MVSKVGTEVVVMTREVTEVAVTAVDMISTAVTKADTAVRPDMVDMAAVSIKVRDTVSKK